MNGLFFKKKLGLLMINDELSCWKNNFTTKKKMMIVGGHSWMLRGFCSSNPLKLVQV